MSDGLIVFLATIYLLLLIFVLLVLICQIEPRSRTESFLFGASAPKTTGVSNIPIELPVNATQFQKHLGKTDNF